MLPSFEGVGETFVEGALRESSFLGVRGAVPPVCMRAIFSAMSLAPAPALPAEKLGARLGGCVDGKLQLSLSEAEGESLSDGEMEPVVEEEVFCFVWGTPLVPLGLLLESCSASCARSLRVGPADLG